MGMEGSIKNLTQEELAKNKTREKVVENIVARDGGIRVADRGEVEIVASEEVKSRAKSDMENEIYNNSFREKYKDLIGKNVSVVFLKDLDSASTDPLTSGWKSFVPGLGDRKEKTIHATLKDISGISATLEFEGKEIEVYILEIEEMRLAD